MSLSSLRKPKVFILSFLLLSLFSFAGIRKAIVEAEPVFMNVEDSVITCKKTSLYDSLQLGGLGLCREAFDCAMKGFNYLSAAGKLKNSSIVSIVDFSLNSCRKRLFVIDLQSGKLLFNSFVAHGRNSGREKATTFSNEPESFKSSLGFYVTAGTYNGDHGYSLRLQGEEHGINDNALSRGIVMHSAVYVNEKVAQSQGYIGRSLGCPALPEGLHKSIIEKIKDGSCLFLYSPDKFYITHSKFIS